MLAIIQRLEINRGAKLINEVNDLYSKGEIIKAEKLKRKVSKDPAKLYWMTQKAYELRMRGV